SWNPGAEALLDIPTADALARKFRDLDISYRVEGLRARIEDVKARHAASRMDDVMFTRRNGEAVHTDITIAPLFEASRFVGVLVWTSWNQAAERMWGLRAGEATGRDVMALPLGDATRILRTPLETVSKRGVPVEVRDVPYTLPGGEVRTAVVKLAPLHEGGGE